MKGGKATASETLAHLEHAIALRLGSLQGGVQPLLQEAHEHCAVLAPAPGGQRPPPKEQQERQKQLAGVLDQMEDVLEALYLAVRSGHDVYVSREAQR